MPGVRVEAAEVREERVRPVAAGDVAHQEVDHRTPPGDPRRIPPTEHPGRAQEIAVVEMVVIQLDVAAEAGRVADQSSPARVIGEDAFAGLLRAAIHGRGEEVLQRGLQATLALRRGGRVAQLLRQPQQGGPLAELLAQPIGVAAQLGLPREVLREERAQLGAVGVRRHRQVREERRERISFLPALRPRLDLHRPADALIRELGGQGGGAPLVRVAREERPRRPGFLHRVGRRPCRPHAARRRIEGVGDVEPRDVVVGARAERVERGGLAVGQERCAEPIAPLRRIHREQVRPLARPARAGRRVEAVGTPGDLDDEFAALVAEDLGGRLEAHHGCAALKGAIDEG